ncbi:MAG: hypothetical protein ACR2K2_01275, partial [Mycobacteriales bacterium]
MLVALVGLVPATAVAEEPAWTWPLAGPQEVSRPFDPPATRYSAGHRGADLPGDPGSVVRAAGAGRVSYAGLLAGRGVVVVVHWEPTCAPPTGVRSRLCLPRLARAAVSSSAERVDECTAEVVHLPPVEVGTPSAFSR